MCGITGFISPSREVSVDSRLPILKSMCDVIRHRGPDEDGMVVSGRAALGMRRLSIIDLKCGQQPIYNEDRSLSIVFNGEIYNFLDLRTQLESLGHRFRTMSDTEVILHAFEEFGAKCLDKLRGMFAFAIWNHRTEELFLARDRVGKKPLFYGSTKDGTFIFGSEIKSILAYGDRDRKVDLSALDAYFTLGYVPEEFCIFQNLHKLPPGHYLRFHNEKSEIKRYWDFDFSRDDQSRTDEEYAQELVIKIRDAVRVRMVSEVPLGAFLSGGIDSSTVVGMMSELSSQPVKTFSIGFNEDNYDELKYARIAARQFRTEHHEFIVTPDLVDTIDKLVWHFDEPFGDSSAIPTYLVSKMARDFVTVVLTGDGGDELFGGYSRYVTQIRRTNYARLPAFLRKELFRAASRAAPHSAPGKHFLYNISLDTIDRYLDSVSIFNELRKEALYSSDLRARLNGSADAAAKLFTELQENKPGLDPTEHLLYIDSKTYLPGDILTKVDRTTMAASVEGRSPLLDHELIEFAAKLPIDLKIKGLETKHVLKQAMTGTVPPEILHRKKQGFGIPISEWINQQLGDRIRDDLLSRTHLERGYFNQEYLLSLFKEHSTHRRDNSHLLWTLWACELWHRKYVDGTE